MFALLAASIWNDASGQARESMKKEEASRTSASRTVVDTPSAWKEEAFSTLTEREGLDVKERKRAPTLERWTSLNALKAPSSRILTESGTSLLVLTP